MFDEFAFERRRFPRAAALGSAAAGLAGVLPAWAEPISSGLVRPLPSVSGAEIGIVAVRVDGKVSRAVGVNGTVPAPLVRLREGQRVRLRANKTLDEESSIHWHGLLVPVPTGCRPAGFRPASTPCAQDSWARAS